MWLIDSPNDSPGTHDAPNLPPLPLASWGTLHFVDCPTAGAIILIVCKCCSAALQFMFSPCCKFNRAHTHGQKDTGRTRVNVAMQIPNMGKNAIASAATNASVAPRPATVKAYTGCKQRATEGPLQLQLPLIYGDWRQERTQGGSKGNNSTISGKKII